jgi:hypothetical protein
MPRGAFENRYLRHYSGGVQVRIVRLGVNYSRKFHYRVHGGKDLAHNKARRHRDRIYAEIFGERLIDSSHLLRPRGKSEYPAGISSLTNQDGEVFAFIISWQSATNETVREYMAITETQGLKEAIELRVKAISSKYESDDSV